MTDALFPPPRPLEADAMQALLSTLVHPSTCILRIHRQHPRQPGMPHAQSPVVIYRPSFSREETDRTTGTRQAFTRTLSPMPRGQRSGMTIACSLPLHSSAVRGDHDSSPETRDFISNWLLSFRSA